MRGSLIRRLRRAFTSANTNSNIHLHSQSPIKVNEALQSLNLSAHPRVLVFAPHPDDEVFGCGGLLALLAASGASISVHVVTDGGYGKFGQNKDVRKRESLDAAALLGYPAPHFWDLPDQGLRLDTPLISRIQAELETQRPDLILCPSIWETHPDHLTLAHGVIEAARGTAYSACILFYEVGAPMPTSLIIDISTVADRKRAAMQCFPSQLAVQNYDLHIEGLNRYRTYTLGKEAILAEGYCRLDKVLMNAGGVSLPRLSGPPHHASRPARVSILIRSTNRPELHQAVESALAQTHPNIELIVLNATKAPDFPKLQGYGTRTVQVLDPAIPLERAAAANYLLAHHTGEYFLFLDDDDWILPTHVSALLKTLLLRTDIAGAYGDTQCLEHRNGEWIELRRFEGSVAPQHLLFDNHFPIHSVLLRSAAVQGLQFDTRFDLYEDWDWWLQVSPRGPLLHVPGIGAIYRIHGKSGEGVRAEPERAHRALKQIAEKWHRNADLEQTVERLAYVRQLAQALTQEQTRSSALGAQQDEAQREMARLKAQHEDALRRYADTLALRDEEIRTLLAAHQQLQTGLLQTSSQIHSATQLQPALEQLHTHVEELEALLLHARNEAAAHEATIAGLRSTVQNQEETVEHLRQHVQMLQKQLNIIHNSHSWLMTKPVRATGRLVRRLAQHRNEDDKNSLSHNAYTHGSLVQKILHLAKGSHLVRQVYYRLPLSDEQRFKVRTLGRGAPPSSRVTPRMQVSAEHPSPPSAPLLTYLDIPAHHTVAPTLSVENLPQVSIIIPCFNQGHFLVDSLASAHASYSGPVEVIVVNDGSTDPFSLRCLRDMAAIYPDVHFIHQENSGLSASRNTGIAAANGDYIQFLDADDLLVPGKLDAQVAHLLDGDRDVSICNYLIADAQLNNHAKTDETIANHGSFELKDFLFKWERSLSIPIHCGLFSRRALSEIRFNTELHAKEDWVFWCTLASNGFIPHYIDFHGAVYRMHQGSMRRSFVRMARQWMQAVTYLDKNVASAYPSFFEESVLWMNRYYRSNPIYQDEIKHIEGQS
jgi:glycosyltransferase involved in cell wall biosynthesis/LmbE family N-acetylglucosaminyl deacetylase